MDKEKLVKIIEFLESIGYILKGHGVHGDRLDIEAVKKPTENV